MKQLYKISEDFRGLMDLVESGDVSEEMIDDTLKGVQGMFEEKAKGVVMVAEEFTRNVATIDAEINRLKDLKTSLTSRQNSLKEYLRINMERTGINKIDCDLFKITLRKGTPIAVINDESALPDDYVTVKTLVSPDKRKILADLKQGVDIEGAELETGKSSILIK